MNAVGAIEKKRDGGKLSDGEIAAFVEGFARGEIPDYQAAAWAMAVFLRGMDTLETAALTEALLQSGSCLHWVGVAGTRVDKHSTGGVGDKTSLVLAPLLASCGLVVPMICGRGLGLAGGTLDKLEAIPGLQTDLCEERIREQAESVGCAIVGPTKQLVPADRRFSALRHATGTGPSVPLIVASIMSKKLAENLDALVFDVKWGSGAFMKSLAQARHLAQALVAMAQCRGLAACALVTDMNQPLGRFVGHAVEVNEARAALRGEGPADLRELVFRLGAELLIRAGAAESTEQAVGYFEQKIRTGYAAECFDRMVRAQGGNPSAQLAVAEASTVSTSRQGFVTAIDAAKIALALARLGGSRTVIQDHIDHSVGIELMVRPGDYVEQGQPLARMFARQRGVEQARRLIREAIALGPRPLALRPLVVESIGADDEEGVP